MSSGYGRPQPGGLGVVGSNPAAPTIMPPDAQACCRRIYGKIVYSRGDR